jgi:hypothetical protein
MLTPLNNNAPDESEALGERFATLLVPRLCLGTHMGEALPRNPKSRQSLVELIPRQSLGMRVVYFFATFSK